MLCMSGGYWLYNRNPVCVAIDISVNALWSLTVRIHFASLVHQHLCYMEVLYMVNSMCQKYVCMFDETKTVDGELF